MSLLKTGQCFTEELALNCPTIVACVTALPTGPAAVAGDRVLGKDGQFHALPGVPAQVPQALTLAGQTLTLSNGGGSVTLPDSDDQTLTLVGNDLSISGGNTVTLPSAPGQVAQVLSIAGNTVSLSGGGGSITVPDNDAQALSIAGNVISLTNGGSVTLPAVTIPFATPAETVAGASTTLAVNPADLYARENIAAQAGLNANPALIPAPTASQSPWGTNTLGETVHYAPGLGWKIVDNQFHATLAANNVALPANVATTIVSIVAPRDGLAIITGKGNTQSPSYRVQTSGVAVNGVWLGNDNNGTMSVVGSAAPGTPLHASDAVNTSSAVTMRVFAGDVIAVQGLVVGAAGIGSGIVYLSYIGS